MTRPLRPVKFFFPKVFFLLFFPKEEIFFFFFFFFFSDFLKKRRKKKKIFLEETVPFFPSAFIDFLPPFTPPLNLFKMCSGEVQSSFQVIFFFASQEDGHSLSKFYQHFQVFFFDVFF